MKEILLLFILCPFFLFGQTQIGLDINGKSKYSYLGKSIKLNLDGSKIVIIGSVLKDNNLYSSYASIYKNENGNWVQIGQDIYNNYYKSASSTSTISLNLNGTIVAFVNSSDVNVYKNENGTLSKIGETLEIDINLNYIGIPLVSFNEDGSLLAIRRFYKEGVGSSSIIKGIIRIYKNNNDNWVQVGNDLYGDSDVLNTGFNVNFNKEGSLVAISAMKNINQGQLDLVHVNVYINKNNQWKQVGESININADYPLNSSLSISGDGSTIAIGAYNSLDKPRTGYVHVFENTQNEWIIKGNVINGESSHDHFGSSISLNSDGSIIAIGGKYNDENGINSGHTRIYKYNDNWNQVGVDINGDLSQDEFGSFVSLSSDGSKVAISALKNDSNGTHSGQVKVYDLNAILSSDSFVLSKFTIYPNPVKNKFTVLVKDNLILEKIYIYNSLGQFIKSSKKSTMNTSNLKSGVYFLQVETNKGKTRKKLVIE